MPGIHRLQRLGEASWTRPVIYGVTGVLVLSLTAFLLIRYVFRQSQFAVFESVHKDLLDLRPHREDKPIDKLCKGRVISIDGLTSEFDEFYFKLPEDLKAHRPELIRTVIYLSWSKEKTHTYGSKPGFTHYCEVEMVDRESKAFLKREKFTGDPPPKEVPSRATEVHGRKPVAEIINFIQANLDLE